MKQIEWFNLYGESWQGEIVPDAFSHPAKYSRALIRKIYQHMLAEGYIKAGDSIVDPFGGVALGGLDAMRYGLHWYGIELEEKFVGLGQQNIELWNGRYRAWFANWGTARLVQGDSRRLVDVLGEAGGCVSSPPFQGTGADDRRPQGGLKNTEELHDLNIYTYGSSPGQLGSMSEGDFDGVVASPPYADGCQHTGGNDPKPEHIKGGHYYGVGLDGSISSPPYAETISKGDGPGVRHDPVHHNGNNATKNSSSSEYGRTEGQLGAMDGSLSSPPYQTGGHHQHQMDAWNTNGRGQLGHSGGYADESPGQLQGDNDTFWSAARVIVDQLHAVLKPGAYAAFVTGDFVRNGQRVEFGRQWLQLCEACGFEAVEWIVCWKREPGPVQVNAFGEDVNHTKDRVSFFRRLANQKNPDNAILNEDVIIVRKPL